MANTYITLSNSNNSLTKKFRVVLGGYKPMLDRTQTRRRTVTGKIDNQEGPICQRWEYTLKAYETEPTDPNGEDGATEGYGTLAHLETFFKYNDPGGTPTNQLTLTDHYGNTHTVVFSGSMAPVPISVHIAGVNAEHHVPVVLEETTAVG
jgi:hypothetical protein